MGIKLIQPKFWRKPTILTLILYPLSLLYGWVVSWIIGQKRPRKLPITSICIGNLRMGGAGKTPLCIALAELLRDQGLDAHIVFKAYQSKAMQTVYVNSSPLNPKDIGDEPYMVAQKGIPTWVGPARFEAAMSAYQSGAQVVIFDDGFQDLRVHMDVRGLIFEPSLEVCHVFPAGPLREPLETALKRADVLCVEEHYAAYDLPKSKDIIFYRRLLEFAPGFVKELPSLAFCGIGNPDQFEKTLKENTVNVVNFRVFPDHYAYQAEDIDEIFKCAKSSNLQILTTEKDIVKIPEKYASQIHVITLNVEFLDPEKILTCLLSQEKILSDC